MTQKELFTPREAVADLEERGVKTTEGTLAKWRSEGGGPKFHKVGNRVLYSAPSLQEYARERIGPEFSSTSEARAARDCQHTS